MNKHQFAKITPLLSLVGSVFVSVVSSTALFAQSSPIQDGANAVQGNGQPTNLFGAAGVLTTISGLLLYIIGALAVIMIIFGGLRYVVSGGNSASVTAAKNTILYAIVGIIVALLAYAIVNFVLGSFAPSGAGSGTNL